MSSTERWIEKVETRWAKTKPVPLTGTNLVDQIQIDRIPIGDTIQSTEKSKILWQQTQLPGPRHSLDALGHVELAIDVIDMRLDGTECDKEPFGDFTV